MYVRGYIDIVSIVDKKSECTWNIHIDILWEKTSQNSEAVRMTMQINVEWIREREKWKNNE